MGAEASASPLLRLGVAEDVLDMLPTALTLIEPGTGRVLYANRPARADAGRLGDARAVARRR
jgi:hypothetical protein